MRLVRLAASLAVALVLLSLVEPAAADEIEDGLAKINLPPGFAIEIYARIPNARSMAVVGHLGAVFVGSRVADTVHVLTDHDNDFHIDNVRVFVRGLRMPNGIVFKNGWLYVVSQRRIIRFPVTLGKSDISNAELLFEGLPGFSHHGWRYAAIGPDDMLYIAVGAPCNVCKTKGLEGTIVRMSLDGSAGPEIYASGIRNSVGIDFHPQSGEMYFTDNGADGMGDLIPPDELNRAATAGLAFGFPHYGGGNIFPVRNAGRSIIGGEADPSPPPELTMPAMEFGAHAAALGFHFYRGHMFPAEYRGDAFVAQHGSWNRSDPFGYRIVRVRFDDEGNPASKTVFADGWLQNGQAWGRPVDIKELDDGSLLVSDDYAEVLYRITYSKKP